jgi:hypothetical protein
MLQWQQQPPSAGSLVARPSPKRPPSLQSEHRLPHGAAVHAVRALIELQEYALYCKHVNTTCESVAASKVHLLFCVEHRPCLLVVFNFSEVKL